MMWFYFVVCFEHWRVVCFSALCVFDICTQKTHSALLCFSIIVCVWNEVELGGREHQAKALGWNADNAEQRGAEESMLMETSGIHGKHACIIILPKKI